MIRKIHRNQLRNQKGFINMVGVIISLAVFAAMAGSGIQLMTTQSRVVNEIKEDTSAFNYAYIAWTDIQNQEYVSIIQGTYNYNLPNPEGYTITIKIDSEVITSNPNIKYKPTSVTIAKDGVNAYTLNANKYTYMGVPIFLLMQKLQILAR